MLCLGQLVHGLRQGQAVGGDAQLDVRGVFGELAEGLERAFGVGERVAGAGDAEHGHLRNLRGDRHGLLHRLVRREQFRHHAGAGFVGAVVFAVAVMALDVAGRGHRHMHAGEIMVGIFRVTGVVVHLFADVVGQMVHLVVGRTAG